MEVDEKVLNIAGKANSKLAFQCNVDNEIVAFVASSIEEREDWCNKIINAVEKVKAVEVSFKKRKKRDTKP